MTKQQRKERRIEAQEIVNKAMAGGRFDFHDAKQMASGQTGLSFWYVHRWVRANPEKFNPEKY